jgi:inhibitor of KinA
MRARPDAVRFVPVGDSAILVEFGDRIDPAINARCIAVAESVRASAPAGVRDVVPTFRSVAVYFDPLQVDYARLLEQLQRAAAEARMPPSTPAQTHHVPVCYGGEFGPDLAAVAAYARLTEDETIARHATRTYRVFMLGFVPGFAYMGVVDEQIAAPRRETPRARVAAGAVGIAGLQTGIYPTDTPGGWQVIGRTPLRLFDARHAKPSLFRPGDAVQFFSIPRNEWDRFAS